MAKGVNKETGFDIVTTADVELEMQTQADADGYLMHPVNPYFHYINLTARQEGLLWENALETWKSGFRNKASKKQLRLLGKTVLGLEPLYAQPARRIITADGTPESSFDAGTVTIRASNGVNFINVNAIQFPAAVEGKSSLDFEIIATTTGPSGNITPDTVLSVTAGAGIEAPQMLDLEPSRVDTPIASIGNAWRAVPVNAVGYGQEVLVEDLEHPLSLEKITWSIRNPSSEKLFFTLYTSILSASGDIIGRTELQLMYLDGLEEKLVTFEGFDISAQGNEMVFVQLINSGSSQGPIEIEVNDADAYAGGSFREATIPQEDIDAVLTITTSVDAIVANGRDDEDDVDYQIRWSTRKDIFGGSHPEAVAAYVREQRFVQSAEWESNFEDFPNANGVPPHTGMIIVQGGRVNEISQAIFDKWPWGLRIHGNIYGMALDKAGRVIPVPFFRPTEVKWYVRVETGRTEFFRPRIDSVGIQDGVKGYGGGVLSAGLEVDSLNISEHVEYEKVVAAVQAFDDSDRKLKSLKVFIGTDPDDLGREDIIIPKGQVAKLEEVEVI